MARGTLVTSGLVIRDSLRMLYDNLGTVAIASFLWFFVGLAPAVVLVLSGVTQAGLVLLALLLTVLTVGPATAGAFYLIGKLVKEEAENPFRVFFCGWRRYLGRSIALVLINVVFLAILAADFAFTLRHPSPYVRILTGLWFYFLLFWLLHANYVFAVLIQQNTRVFETIKQAALLVVDNIGYSLQLVIVQVLLTGLFILVLPVVVFLWMGTMALFQTNALLEVLKKYRLSKDKEEDDRPDQ